MMTIVREFISPGQTVNKEFYRDVLRHLREVMSRKRPEKWCPSDWVLHHDNARPHTAYNVQEILAKNKMAVVPHPPYSPDLAPCDFFLFPKMKIKLKGRRFDTAEEIQTKHPNKERLPGCISKVVETLGSVYALPRGLL
jgi:histone-lysine N-methyltransferase SETMAR